MPSEPLNFKNPKKRPTPTSVDGFVPRKRSHLAGPQYYSSRAPIHSGPRRRLVERQPFEKESFKEAEKELVEDAELSPFDRPDSNIFEEHRSEQPKKKSRKEKKAEKKQAKKDKRIDAKDIRGLRGWWKRRSGKFKVGFIILIIMAVTGGLLGYRLLNFVNSVFGRGIGNSKSAALNEEISPSQLNTEGDGRLNILMLGRGGTENQAPDLTDTIMIASVDLKNQTASLFSIPRDTYVGNESDNSKINGVFSRAKEQALYRKKTKDQAEDAGIVAITAKAREIAGVPIHKYVLTDYKAFRDVVNSLGGVDVTVPQPIYDRFTGWKFKKGLQTMNGDMALKYARTRHGSARGDFDRNENQRRLLVAMRQKATSTGIVANPVRLNSLANAVQKNIRTDLSLDEAKTIFGKTKNLPENKILSLDLAKPDGPLIQTGMAYGQSIVRPIAGLEDYSKIRAYTRTNMMDPYLKKEAPTIAIYNGSNKTGLAATVGDILAGYGYKVIAKESAKEDQPKTVVVKMKKDIKKPFTERFLSVRFKTVINSTLPSNVVETPAPSSNSSTTTTATTPPQPDYIIVLGTDFKLPTGPTW